MKECPWAEHLTSLGIVHGWVLFLHLTTNDDYSHHQNSAACYQLAKSVLKIGSALTESVGQVGGDNSAWQLLQLAVEQPWSVLAAWALFLLSCTNGCRKPSFHLVGTPFQSALTTFKDKKYEYKLQDSLYSL